MRNHILLVVFWAVSLTFSLSGCQKQELQKTEGNRIEITEPSEPTEPPTETEETTESLKEQVEIGQTKGNLDGMILYSSLPFMYEETEWELQTYVQETMLVDGELALDDRGHFLIQVLSGEASYVLLDEIIQLGIPEADVWIDDQEKLHIVLRDVRTARYRVTDFIYDSEEKEFIGTDVMDGDGINYMGTTGK